mmetsp:Transcript_24887/g.45685  ORF Transcript_24887/g.45685 Transcript_24887/m.45685 type:complete len:359 (-) Transcript_24887:238-1314(-)
MEPPVESVTVTALSGDVVAVVTPFPNSVAELRTAIAAQSGVPALQQQLIHNEGVLEEEDALSEGMTNLTLIVDERPLATWDIDNNPDCKQISGHEGHVEFTDAATDYVLVLTKAPVHAGRHYFEFVMHRIGDEQWCGVVTDASRAGHSCGEAIYSYRKGSRKPGWFYYCGRRAVFHREEAVTLQDGAGSPAVSDAGKKGNDGCASLHAGEERNAVKLFASVGDGDVIGMLVDIDLGSLIFLCNGEVQGGCKIPQQPMYLSTCLDRMEDHVELRKLPLSQAPPQAIEALNGTLYPLNTVTSFGSDQGSRASSPSLCSSPSTATSPGELYAEVDAPLPDEVPDTDLVSPARVERHWSEHD